MKLPEKNNIFEQKKTMFFDAEANVFEPKTILKTKRTNDLPTSEAPI